jgi:membrane protease YdiL (CAAX protease family)
MPDPGQTPDSSSAGPGESARDDPGPGESARTPKLRPAVVTVAVLVTGTARFLEVFAGETPETGALVWSTSLTVLVGAGLAWWTADWTARPFTLPSTASRALLVGGLARYVVVGVCLTAVGEELLFRGGVLRAFEGRLPFHGANLAQAGLFGLWHLAWPLTLAVGPAEPPVALPVLALGTVLVTGLVGVVFGMLTRATETLWTPVLAHLVHNGVAVVVHVRAAGVDRAGVLSPVLVLGYAVLAWLVWRRFEGRLFETV